MAKKHGYILFKVYKYRQNMTKIHPIPSHKPYLVSRSSLESYVIALSVFGGAN